MAYKVFWLPYAEQRLERILSDPLYATEFAERARRINKALARDPIGFGESRYDTVRIGFALPLAVQYDVLADVRTVIVIDAWRSDHG